jgi:3-isopropylmalate dehydrogenase
VSPGPDSLSANQLHLGLLPGDGIGPEIVAAAVRLAESALHAVGHSVVWQELPFGFTAIESDCDPLPQRTLDALDDLDAWVLGPHDNAQYPSAFAGLSPGGAIRKRYHLYANIRPARALISEAVCPGMDVVIVRQNTEGFYADRNMHDGAGEFMPTSDVALAVAVFTRSACERIAHTAFRLAASRSRLVTIAHKSNVLPKTTGMFRDTCLAVARHYPDVTVRSEHIDALAARLVSHSDEFDVIVAENMFGDILSDLTAQLTGSLGMAPSINASSTRAMAQATHGSAPALAGTNTANPVAMMLSVSMLLRWLADRQQRQRLGLAAQLIDVAIQNVLTAGARTRDIGGDCTTMDFTDCALAELSRIASKDAAPYPRENCHRLRRYAVAAPADSRPMIAVESGEVANDFDGAAPHEAGDCIGRGVPPWQ